MAKSSGSIRNRDLNDALSLTERVASFNKRYPVGSFVTVPITQTRVATVEIIAPAKVVCKNYMSFPYFKTTNGEYLISLVRKYQ